MTATTKLSRLDDTSAHVRDDAQRLALIVVHREAAQPSGDLFRRMRRALGLRASDIAALFDVSEETVSRWEREHRPIPRASFALLDALVCDAIDGRTATMRLLRSLMDDRSTTGKTGATKRKAHR